jgi:hypothetical protein
MWTDLQAQHHEDRKRLDQEMRDLLVEDSELELDMMNAVRREGLLAERAAIGQAYQRGEITEEACRHLLAEIDQRIETVTPTKQNLFADE